MNFKWVLLKESPQPLSPNIIAPDHGLFSPFESGGLGSVDEASDWLIKSSRNGLTATARVVPPLRLYPKWPFFLTRTLFLTRQWAFQDAQSVFKPAFERKAAQCWSQLNALGCGGSGGSSLLTRFLLISSPCIYPCSAGGAPGLNLFFLMGHNCSVDVYFLISSDITGAPVIKHGRLEEKSVSGKRGGELGGREQRQRAQTGGLRAEEEIKKEVDTLSASLRHVGRAVTGNVTRLRIKKRRKTTLSVGTVSGKKAVSAKLTWKSTRIQRIHWKWKHFTKTVSWLIDDEMLLFIPPMDFIPDKTLFRS